MEKVNGVSVYCGIGHSIIAKLTFNEYGVMIEMNATHVKKETLEELSAYEINKENLRFFHNYYPLVFNKGKSSSIILPIVA